MPITTTPAKAFKTIVAFLIGSATFTFGSYAPAMAETADDLSAPAIGAHRRFNDIPPRLQWEANYGYCGEVSFINAGLYYGQYVSQYDARAIASKNRGQSLEESQLLIGVNDLHAAEQMHLKAEPWKDTSVESTKKFLTWVKTNTAAGFPVIIGVYYNKRSFEVSNDPSAGDNEYDHIVPVTGISSTHPLSSRSYYGDDVVTLSDNGLWSPDGKPEYIFNFPFASSQATRKEANSKAHPVYSIPRGVRNYGVAIKGILDRDGQTLPVRLSTNVNYEKPAMREGENKRPKPQNLILTVKVSGLKPGTSYKLYRYDNFKAVPNSSFNANAPKASKSWDLKIEKGSSFTVKEKISSNDIAVYRAVPATAP